MANITKGIIVNIEDIFPEVKRINYMMRWCKKSKNLKTRIKILKHCLKITNNFLDGKWKVRQLKK